MIPSTTGAARAIGLVIPEMEGPTTVSEVNRVLEDAASGPLKGILAYSNIPLVSIDYRGNPHSAIIDVLSTRVAGSGWSRAWPGTRMNGATPAACAIW